MIVQLNFEHNELLREKKKNNKTVTVGFVACQTIIMIELFTTSFIRLSEEVLYPQRYFLDLLALFFFSKHCKNILLNHTQNQNVTNTLRIDV